jgi:hypothetical protein
MMVMVMEVTKKMMKCFTFGKEEREKQKCAQDKGICDMAILFCTLLTVTTCIYA